MENSFRFFTDAADTEVHRATYLALPPEERLRQPVLAAERALSRRHDEGWSATMFRNTCWDGRTNRFVCPDGGDYVNPLSHRVIATDRRHRRSLAAHLHLAHCAAWWRADLRGMVVTQPCSAEVSFDVPYPEGATAKVEIGGREVASLGYTRARPARRRHG